MSVRIVMVSDTHNQLDKIFDSIPEGDFLLHSGDALGYGTLPELNKFNYEMGKLKQEKGFIKVFYTAGNHDGCVSESSSLAEGILTNVELVLHDEFYLHKDGLSIKCFGSPYSPRFGNWWFMYDRNDAKNLWSRIPEDTEILMTHTPAYGRLDKIPLHYVRPGETEYVGCTTLRKRIEQINPLLAISGHTHLQGGQFRKYGKTLFVNAAICTEAYKPDNKPVVVDVFVQDGQKIVEVVNSIS